MRVVVTGISLSSALGDLSQTWQGILAEKTGLKVTQPFPELPAHPMGLIGLTPQNNLTHLAQGLATEALLSAYLNPPLPDCGVVVGSSRHHQNQWESLAHSAYQHRTHNSPASAVGLPQSLTDWMQLWPGSIAIATAQSLNSTAPVLSPMAACATGLWAIAQGFELIQMGLCQQVLVMAVETPITPLALTGFNQAGILARTGVYPFDCDHEGLALAEGGAALVLESWESAQSRQVQPYGEILGFGLAADAYHVSTPDPQGRGARQAVSLALAHSGISAHQIDYIHAHGTGTPWNDLTEAQLIQARFPQLPFCSSTKGATGHTLGASGALGAAITMMALKTQTLPPNVGLNQPGCDLPLVTKATAFPLRHALCFSFGFGGQCAAIAFRHSPETLQSL